MGQITNNEHTWRDITMEILMERLEEMPEGFQESTVHDCSHADYNSRLYQIGFEFNVLERRIRDKVFTMFDERVIMP